MTVAIGAKPLLLPGPAVAAACCRHGRINNSTGAVTRAAVATKRMVVASVDLIVAAAREPTPAAVTCGVVVHMNYLWPELRLTRLV